MTNVSRNILHVDDDPSMLRIVSHELGKRGYDVTSITEPDEALQRLLDTSTRLVLLDINMPEHNGLHLLKEIKRQDGGVQVIMLTGMVSMSTVLRSMRWGAEACLFKPISDFELLHSAVDGAFKKIDRWWQTLDELKHRRECEQDSAVSTVQ